MPGKARHTSRPVRITQASRTDAAHSPPRTAARRNEPRHTDLWIALLLAAGSFVVYIPSLSNDFVEYDDPMYVTRNAMVKKGLTLEGIRWAFTTTHFQNWLPVTWLSHMLDVQIWGLRPGGHHATTAALHAANAAMVFLFLRRATGARWRSAAVGAVWAVHPLRVESVTWIAERKDVLAATFFLLMLLAYLRYCRRPSVRRYAVVALCLVLGLMSKTMLVTAPCVLLLLDYWPFRLFRFSPQPMETHGGAGVDVADAQTAPKSAGWLVLEKLPLLVPALIASAWTSLLQEGAMTSLHGLTLWQRVANAIVSVIRYLGMTIRPTDLVVFYPHPGSWPLWKVAASAAVILLICAAVLATARRRPWLAVGWFWFLGMLVPVLGIIQVGAQAMADRYMYLPHIGLFLALAWSIHEWVQRQPKLRPALAPAVVGLVLVLAAGSWLQQRYWYSTLDLFEHALLVDERNWAAHDAVGQIMEAQGDTGGAIKHFERSIELFPEHQDARYHYGFALFTFGRVDEAIEQLQLAARLAPNWPAPKLWLSIALMQKKQYDDAFRAIESAARLAPADPDVFAQWGRLLLATGRREQARAAFQEALRLDPGHQGALEGLRSMNDPKYPSTDPVTRPAAGALLS
jgi:Tfp pilus assembly protein PilF